MVFLAEGLQLRDRLSDRAETKCKLISEKFQENQIIAIFEFRPGRPLSLCKSCRRKMKLVLLNWKCCDEFNGVTLSSLRLSLQYDSPEITILTEWVLCKKREQLTYVSATLLLRQKLVLTSEKVVLCQFCSYFSLVFDSLRLKISFFRAILEQFMD